MNVASPIVLAVVGGALVVLIMFGLWLLGLRQRNFSYVDIGWAANFAVLALVWGTLAPGWPARKLLIGSLFALHGLRLAWHLARRVVGQPEEGRYVALRAEWGARGLLNLRFLLFFEFQAALNLFLALPLLICCLNPAVGLQPLEWLGTALVLIGLSGESIADEQLNSFKRAPAHRGQVCAVGLWRYSRHPNYFFEWVIWIGYAVFALASPHGWIALVMPLVMLHFLINVTGVRATEEQALRSKGERYRDYQQRTSAFIPWPPRTQGTQP